MRTYGRWVSAGAFAWLATAFLAARAVAAPAPVGLLEIDGSHVESLVLARKDGHLQTLNRPGKNVQLPVGRYRLAAIRLAKGLSWQARPDEQASWFEVTAEAPYRLTVGTPLKPFVDVWTGNRRLELAYSVVDGAGRHFRAATSPPPRFKVFKGDEEIGSGAFEHG